MREGGMLIAKVHQLAGRVFAKRLKEHGIDINPAQGRILFVLWQKDEIPISQLARETMLEKSTLTSMLDRLEETGHIRRVASRVDRRQAIIKRTMRDKAVEQLYREVSDAMTELFYSGFSVEEVDRFEDNLRRILANLATASALFPPASTQVQKDHSTCANATT